MTLRLLILSVLLSLLTANTSFATLALKSHRAIYDLSLDRADEGSGVENATGRIIHEWSRQCDGTIMNELSLFILQAATGKNITTQEESTIWESVDGRSYRFFSHQITNGTSTKKISGSAVKDQPDGGGRATYLQPKEKILKLPARVRFPTKLTEAAITRALRGDKTFASLLFDGTDEGGALQSSVAFGAPFKKTPDYANKYKLLRNITGWPTQIAYFKLDSATALPQVQATIDLFSNGIAGNMMFDYGDFSVRAILKELSSIKEPLCEK